MGAQLTSRVSGRGLAAFLVAVALAPWLAPNAYIVQVLAVAGLNVMMATGLNLLMGFAGQVSLGQGGFFAIGAYTLGLLTAKAHWNPWLALVIAPVVTLAVGYLVGLPLLRLRGHHLAVATLAMGIIV